MSSAFCYLANPTCFPSRRATEQSWMSSAGEASNRESLNKLTERRRRRTDSLSVAGHVRQDD
jgi:hypothetical protein